MPKIHVVVDDLDIVLPPRQAPARYDPLSVMRLPGFWRGCLTTRAQVMAQAADDYERAVHVAAITRIEAIQDALDGGADLVTIPEFQRWLAHDQA